MLKKSGIAALCLAGVILAVMVSAKVWVIPGIISSRIKSGLLNIWRGEVNVEGVVFNYLEPTAVRRVSLEDTNGRMLLQAESIRMKLSKRRWIYSGISELEIERLRCRIDVGDKESFAGIAGRGRGGTVAGGGLSDLRRATVHNGTVVLCGGDSRFELGHLELDMNKMAGEYHVVLREGLSGEPRAFLVSGVIDEDLDMLLCGEIDRFFSSNFVRSMLCVFDISQEYGAQGNIAGEMMVSGSLRDVNSLTVKAQGQFSQWGLIRKEAAVAEDVNFRIEIDGRRCEIKDLTGVICGGKLSGWLLGGEIAKADGTYRGDISVNEIDLTQFSSTFEQEWSFAKGRCSGEYAFKFGGQWPDGLKGTGVIFVDNADLSMIGIVGELFTRIGLSRYDPMGASDAAASFTTSGAEVFIEDAMVSNRLAALRVERGGRVDLRSGQLDFNVIAVPLKQIDKIVRAIPIVRIFGGLKDKLVRLRVAGHWSQPPGKLITKQPLEDVKEGTVGFLSEVVESGGQITQNMRQRVSGVLKRFEKTDAQGQ